MIDLWTWFIMEVGSVLLALLFTGTCKDMSVGLGGSELTGNHL